MGTFRDYDGGITYLPFNYLSAVFGFNDFSVMIRFVPRNVLETDVEFTWLVDQSAQEGRDYDVDRLMAVWDTTTIQDKTIVENNQLGVLSERYEPGMYSRHEATVVNFKQWYLKNFEQEASA